MAPTLPAPGFTREVTPTWLAAATLLAGQRPPDVTEIERYVHLGCGDGETVAVVAANHPRTEVWAWDQHPGSLEATRRLAAEAGLDNLRVHEHRDFPVDLGGGPADVIVVQDVPTAADDSLRHRLAAAIDATLRPGGLLCITYPTLAGWVEVAPVQALMRQLARRPSRWPRRGGARGAGGDRAAAGGRRPLPDRPPGGGGLARHPGRRWTPAEVEARFLRDPFRPMSPAQSPPRWPRPRASSSAALDRPTTSTSISPPRSPPRCERR